MQFKSTIADESALLTEEEREEAILTGELSECADKPEAVTQVAAPVEPPSAIADYRALLTKMEQQAQATFDKTVLTLSGGALGLSFAFTKDVVGAHNVIHTGFLLAAWIGWGLSATSVLGSFFTSQLALRKAISQLDEGKLGTDAEKMERPGGWYDSLTANLNFAGLALFLGGLAAMMFFLTCNLKDHMNEPNEPLQRTANDGFRVPIIPSDVQVAISAGSLVPVPPVSLYRLADPVAVTPQEHAAPAPAQNPPAGPTQKPPPTNATVK